MMKGQKEAGVLRQQLEKLKEQQAIQRARIEIERKKREGIPITNDDQVGRPTKMQYAIDKRLLNNIYSME